MFTHVILNKYKVLEYLLVIDALKWLRLRHRKEVVRVDGQILGLREPVILIGLFYDPEAQVLHMVKVVKGRTYTMGLL